MMPPLQLSMPVLPVADPEWEASIEAERRAEERQIERERLAREVISLAQRSDFFGYVSTETVLEEVGGLARGVEHDEAPVAFRSMAARLRDLSRRGMIERLGGYTTGGRREPVLWGAACF